MKVIKLKINSNHIYYLSDGISRVLVIVIHGVVGVVMATFY